MESVVTFFLDPAVRERGGSFEAPRIGDAGFDIRAAGSTVIESGSQVLVPTGLWLAIPVGWVGIVKDRSSMALKGIYTHAGVIDASYRGELKVLLSNSTSDAFVIEEGAKIAQLVVVPHCGAAEAVTSKDLLGSTVRAEGGFGSTGR